MLYNFEQEQSWRDYRESLLLHAAKRYRSSLKYEGSAWWYTRAEYSRPVKHTYFMKSIVCVWHNVPVSGLYRDFTGKTDKQTNKTVKKWKLNTDNIFDFFKTLDDMFGQ